MVSYQMYGLCIGSELRLPELVPSIASCDVNIRLSSIEHDGINGSLDQGCLFATPDEICLFWDEVGTFLVRGGREIIIDPADGVPARVLRLFVLGRVLGALLQQRGLLVLHASAVRLNGAAIAFMGGKGWGKSTMAAALHRYGHSVIADDIVAVGIGSGEAPDVYPGFPQLKLWPEAAEALGLVPEQLPKLHPSFEKRARRVDEGFSVTPVPLKHLYVLNDGEAEEILPLKPKDAFVELVRHSYALGLLRPTGAAANHFHQCERLVSRVPLFHLSRRRSLESLSVLAALVEKHLDSVASHGKETI